PTSFRHALTDLNDLCRRLHLAENNFGHAVAQGTLMIESRVRVRADRLHGRPAHALQRGRRIDAPRRHVVEQCTQLFSIHAILRPVPPPSSPVETDCVEAAMRSTGKNSPFPAAAKEAEMPGSAVIPCLRSRYSVVRGRASSCIRQEAHRNGGSTVL